jgi:signal peptidase II
VTRARGSARAVAVTGVVLAADQASKAVVRGSIDRGEAVALLPFLDLVNVRNPGIAFGLLSGGGVLLILLAVAAMVVLASVFFVHADTPLAWMPSGLLLGGALGNLVDRVREGAVTDFIDLPRWPAFNLADSAITVGVVALIYVLEGPPRKKREAGA